MYPEEEGDVLESIEVVGSDSAEPEFVVPALSRTSVMVGNCISETALAKERDLEGDVFGEKPKE